MNVRAAELSPQKAGEISRTYLTRNIRAVLPVGLWVVTVLLELAASKLVSSLARPPSESRNWPVVPQVG